jgi:hypothetical protein
MTDDVDPGPPPGFERDRLALADDALDEATEKLFKDRLGRMDRWALSNVVKALPHYVAADEQLLGLAAPMFEGEMGLLAVTDRQLVFLVQRSDPDEPLEVDRLQVPYESLLSAGMATVVDLEIVTSERAHLLRGKAKQMAQVASVVAEQSASPARSE